MTVHDRPRTEPIAGRAYTLPVVRENPLPGSLSAPVEPAGPEQRDLVARSLMLRPEGHAPRA